MESRGLFQHLQDDVMEGILPEGPFLFQDFSELGGAAPELGWGRWGTLTLPAASAVLGTGGSLQIPSPPPAACSSGRRGGPGGQAEPDSKWNTWQVCAGGETLPAFSLPPLCPGLMAGA